MLNSGWQDFQGGEMDIDLIDVILLFGTIIVLVLWVWHAGSKGGPAAHPFICYKFKDKKNDNPNITFKGEEN